MGTLYSSDKEYQLHSQAIHSIADQYHYNDEEIREIYEDILEDLQADARCKQYLSVLVMRHVKELLHNSDAKVNQG